MSEKKKRILFTSTIVACAILLLLLGALCLITGAFVYSALLHIFLRLLMAPILIKLIQKCFCKQIPNSMHKALAFCSGTILADLVILDGIRYILNNGVSTVLLLPACIPVCFMILMFYSSRDTGKDPQSEKRLALLIGIPLLLLSSYFEIISFV